MAALPAPVLVPNQWSPAPSVMSVTSCQFIDKDMIPGAVHRLPDIYLESSKTPVNLSQETINEGCVNTHLLKWGALPSNKVGRIAQHVRKGKGRKGGKYGVGIGIVSHIGGLAVTCSPRDPSFAGSNPAEGNGFFQDLKILSTSPLEGSRV